MSGDMSKKADPAGQSEYTLCAMNPDIHYTRSGDTSIAYKVGGKGPPDMVFVPGYISHLEMSWESPLASRVWHRLSSFGRIITFDKRGTGLSDPITDDRLPGLEQRMDDMRAVMDAVGSRRSDLIGRSGGARRSMLAGATYPERLRS